MAFATGAVQMAHTKDPRAELQTSVTPHLKGVELIGSEILVATYIRPEMTRGGIVLPGASRDEDKFQGVSGLVLMLGPLSFVDDETHKFPVKPKVGDWVVYRTSNTVGIHVGKTHCRFVEDMHVYMIVPHPDLVY